MMPPQNNGYYGSGGYVPYGAASQGMAMPINPYDPYMQQAQRLQQLTANQQQANMAQQPQVAEPPPISVLGVETEQQALDHPVDLRGIPQLFTMRDDSAIFAKMFNVKNATVDFKKYVRVGKDDPASEKTPAGGLSPTSIDAVLSQVKKFEDALQKIQNDITDIKQGQKNVQSGGNSQHAGGNQPSNKNNSQSGSGNGAGRQ